MRSSCRRSKSILRRPRSWSACSGLAAAVGIGRFAFTPLLPLMAAQSGLTLSQGGWLAAANYGGYLAGALWCVFATPNPGAAARAGLAGVALFTLAMGLTADFTWWIAWRALAGIASALVLVGISGWTLQRARTRRRAHWSGWVFAGVGVGIGFAGLASLAIGVLGAGAGAGWLLLGAVSAAVLASTWSRLSPSQAAAATRAASAMRSAGASMPTRGASSAATGSPASATSFPRRSCLRWRDS